MSISVFCEKPAAAVASTKIAMATWMSTFRLNRSASLPQIGVEIAVVSRVAVMTQVYAFWSPERSCTMTGNEVETTVEASIDTKVPSRSPMRAGRTRRWAGASREVVAMRNSTRGDGCRDDTGAIS
ncbi:hypothetical protein QE414_002938 [Microbacterium sp. SORGH_AS 344]|nr:hypothetical protein [Microbacterium sp. SORGH_AS_0344]